MIRSILQLGNETLRKNSLLVEDFQSSDLEGLIGDLSDTLQEAQNRFGYGRGIAAPQINELKRVIFIDTQILRSPLINPRIMRVSDRKFEVWDSCFSFDVAFFVLVDRYYRIRVEYDDQAGKQRVIDAENELSELLQHEIDHLDGILATDRMKDIKRIMMRQEWEKTLSPHAITRDVATFSQNPKLECPNFVFGGETNEEERNQHSRSHRKTNQ